MFLEENKAGVTIRDLVRNTFIHFKDRYRNMLVDKIKSVSIQEIIDADCYRRFIITSTSYPQYYPYTAKGIKNQSFRHKYDVILELDRLSINTKAFRIRTGADKKWDFTFTGRNRKDYSGRVIDGTNVKRGINGDFYFRLSYLYDKAGILYGKNYATKPPTETNSRGILFLDKHSLGIIRLLMDKGILKND